MSGECLNGADVVICLQQVGGKGVAEGVAGDSLREFCQADGFVKCFLDIFLMQMISRALLCTVPSSFAAEEKSLSFVPSLTGNFTSFKGEELIIFLPFKWRVRVGMGVAWQCGKVDLGCDSKKSDNACAA